MRRPLPLLDFRPRKLCGTSFIYGFFTGALLAMGLFAVMLPSLPVLIGMVITYICSKLAQEALPLE